MLRFVEHVYLAAQLNELTTGILDAFAFAFAVVFSKVSNGFEISLQTFD